MKKILKIFITFLKISSFTFGGGYAILPLLKSEAVDKNNWITENELSEIFTLSQLVPGLIYVSSATFIGYKVGGILGAAAATIAVLIPSAVSIMLISLLLSNYINSEFVQKALIGIICGVAVLTAIVLKDLIINNIKSRISIIIFICSFILLEGFNIKPVVLILCGLILGITYSAVLSARVKNNA